MELSKTKQVTKDLVWKNIDHEKFRVYQFPNGEYVHVNNPVLLNVSASGGHRILDAEDTSHYIPSGWIHLCWETKDDNAFRF